MSLVTNQLREAKRLEQEGAEPIEILAVLAPEMFEEADITFELDICEHMPDNPDIDKCDFCGYEVS